MNVPFGIDIKRWMTRRSTLAMIISELGRPRHGAGSHVDRSVSMTTMKVMAKKQPFELIYDPEIRGHLDAIEPKYHSLIRTTIEEQLPFEPEKATRNRKQLERPVSFGARWELRLGPDNRFRVFYRVDPDKREVHVLVIAVKKKNRIFIAGEEVEL